MNEIGDLITGYYESPFAKSKLNHLLGTRTKEISTIQDIVYRDDYPSNVHRVVSDDSNACLSDNTFVIMFKLGILPQHPKILGK